MRAVTRTFRHRAGLFGSLFLPLVLAIITLTPLSASASTGLSAPEVEMRAVAVAQDSVPDTPARPAGALLRSLLALVGLVGVGISVQLAAKKYDDKGVETTEGFRLDSESETYAVDLHRFSEAKVEEGAGRVRVELAAAETARDDFRAIAVDEILRVQQLSHTGDDEFDADEERAYLESLPAKTLKLHFKKAREKTLSLKQQTSGEEPGDQTEDAAFGHVTVK